MALLGVWSRVSSSAWLQNESVRRRLIQAQQLWDAVETALTQMMQRSLRTSQTVGYDGSSQLSLQAQRETHHRLQVALEIFPPQFVFKSSFHTDRGVCRSVFMSRQELQRQSGMS